MRLRPDWKWRLLKTIPLIVIFWLLGYWMAGRMIDAPPKVPDRLLPQ